MERALESGYGGEKGDEDKAVICGDSEAYARRENVAEDFHFLASQDELVRLYCYLNESGCEEPMTWLEKFSEELLLTIRRLQGDNVQLEAAIQKERADSLKRLRDLEEEAQAFVDAAEPRIRRELSRKHDLERQRLENELAALRSSQRIAAGAGEPPPPPCAVSTAPCECQRNLSIADALGRMEQQNRALRSELARVRAEGAAVRNDAALKRGGACKPAPVNGDDGRAEDYLSHNYSLMQQIQQLREANLALQDTNDSLVNEVEELRKGRRRRIMPPPDAASIGASSPVDQDGQLHVSLSEELTVAGVNYGLPVCDTILEERGNDDGAFLPESEYSSDGRRAKPRPDGYSIYDAHTGQSFFAAHRRNSNRSSQDGSDSGVHDDKLAPPSPWDAGVQEPGKIYRVILAGDAGVGKTSFIIRLCSGRFSPSTSSTLGVDFQSKSLSLDDKPYTLQLWDTAGQERFRSITRSYFRRADGVLLLFDCTYERSFLSVRKWIDDIEENTSKRPPILVCANKVDLRESAASRGVKVVGSDMGAALAKEYGVLFMESSAKSGCNVVDAVVELTRLMRNAEMTEHTASATRLQKDGVERDLTRANKKCC